MKRRQTHLNGPIAKALMDIAPNLLAVPPTIEKTEILGAKIPQQAAARCTYLGPK
jgi:hypothetical protein